MRRSLLACVAVVAFTSGCYRVTVNTATPPSAGVVARPWSNSFVYGIVPPAPVSTAETCTGGVSQVITQRSFLNGVVSSLTFGLYTPIDIRATCGAGR